MRLIPFLLTGLVIGCNGPDKDTSDTDTYVTSSDADADGYTAETGDCDDDDASVYPGADEVWYDGVDQDCDGANDYDQDGDSVEQGDDCDDTDSAISPIATDVCDGIDNDCDDEIDEGGEFVAYLDADADGFGTGESLGQYCELPVGTASNAEDCDDTTPEVSPLAEELCDGLDNDCDGEIDVGASDGVTVYTDADADGFGDAATGALVCALTPGTVEDATDCDDADSLTNPAAIEVCDLEDNNCDGAIDEGSPDERTYYVDVDADGYGDPAVTLASCGAPAGYVEEGTDCDDADATRSPGATEICDGLDNDCDTEVDVDAVDGLTLYVDADGDGYGDAATLVSTCEGVSGYVEDGTDCDDASADTNPAAAELCDGVDNNCDTVTDEATATDAPLWYVDADLDGYGDPSASTGSCDQPAGFVASDTDCDDADLAVNPAAAEICDGVDQDCDGTVDDSAGDASTWYADGDADGYGDASMGAPACDVPAGYVADDTDCDDTSSLTYPGAAEICDGEDQDCNSLVDDAPTDGVTVYADTDGDGYGDLAMSEIACGEDADSVFDATDCDDGDGAVSPGATEVCDAVDNDCDGTVDGADAADVGMFYADADSDGFGDASAASIACDAPSGTVTNATDCDDSAAAVYPGAVEVCDSVDNDCDGATDESGATGATTWYVDNDGDGYGVSDATTDSCNAPSGYAATADDCDDAEPTAYPTASELDDSLDNDCDAFVDEDFVSAGDVIITEIDRQPRVGSTSTNSNAAWFELYNTTGFDIDLSNWYIRRASTSLAADAFYIDPADSVVIGADDYVVICKTDNFTSASTSYSTLAPCDYYWGNETASASYSSTYEDNTFNLQRDEDTLSLYFGGDASTGTLADSVHWTYSAADGYWPREASRSMQLDLDSYDAIDNDAKESWCAVTNNVYFQWYYVSSSVREYGTPGRDNHTCP
jgi:hypothetical protein